MPSRVNDGKRAKKSKKSKRDLAREDAAVRDDFEDVSDGEELVESRDSKVSSSKSRKKKSKRGDSDNVYDDSMLGESDGNGTDEELTPRVEETSKRMKKGKKSKRSKKNNNSRVTFDSDTKGEESSRDEGERREKKDKKRKKGKEEKSEREKAKRGKGSGKRKSTPEGGIHDDDDEVVDDSDSDWAPGSEDALDSYDEDEDDVDTKRKDGASKLRSKDDFLDDPIDTPRRNSPEMRLLNRFRLALRQVGAHSGGDGFIAALYSHFLGVDRDRNKKIQAAELRDRIKDILRDTEISEFDIKSLINVLDSDGDGTVNWDEFVSFVSFPMAEMRRLVVELRKKMLDEAGSGGSAGDYKRLYESLLNERDRRKGGITLSSFTPYIQRALNLQLTPGEFAEIFRQIDTEGNGVINQLNLSSFLTKSSHDLLAGGSFDDCYCVVDIAVSKTKNDEAHLRHLKYHKINENLNRGAAFRPAVYIWWRSACVDDYENERAFMKDRVTDVIVSPKHRDSMLTAEGFTCIDKSVSSGKIMPGGHAYIWIRKDIKDPQPVLNIAVTSGKAKRPRDKVHFPPFYGFKLTEPEHNLNKSSLFGSDVFLWYRKKHFEAEKARGKAGKLFQKGSGTALAAIAAQVKKVIREAYVDRDGQVDLEKAFSDFDRNRNGYISYRQFRTHLLKLGVHLERQEFASLHDEVCKEGKQVSIKEFFDFVQYKDSDVRSIAKRLRRILKSSASIKGLQATFAELDIDHSGTVTRRRFTKIFKDLDIILTKAEMDAVWRRFDKDESGVVDFNEFLAFVTTDIKDEATDGGEAEASNGGDAAGSKEWLKVNGEACRSAMDVVKSKLKAYSRKGEYGGMASRSNWNMVIKRIQKSGGGRRLDGTLKGGKNTFGLEDSMNASTSSFSNFGKDQELSVTLPEMEAFVEKLLDGRTIRDRMGDHEIRLIAEHFDGGGRFSSSSSSPERRSRSPKRRGRRGVYDDEFDSLEDEFDSLEDDDTDIMDKDADYDDAKYRSRRGRMDQRRDKSKERKGYITGRDLKHGVARKFSPPNKVRREDVMKVDLDKLHSSMHSGSGMLTSARVMNKYLRELISAIKDHARDPDRRGIDWRKAYLLFDKDRTGKVTEGCLTDALAQLGLSKGLSKSDTRRIMSYFDLNRDGFIDRREFRDVCRNPIDVDPSLFDDEIMADDFGLESDYEVNRRGRGSRYYDDASDEDFHMNSFFDDDLTDAKRARSLSPSRDRYGRDADRRLGWRHASTDWDQDPSGANGFGSINWKQQRMRDMKNLKRRGVGIQRLRAAVTRAERRQGRNGLDLYDLFLRFDQFQEGWVSRRDFGRVIHRVGIQVSRIDVRSLMTVFRHVGKSDDFDAFDDSRFDRFDDHRGSRGRDPKRSTGVSYGRFLSCVSARYARALASGKVDPGSGIRLSGEEIRERIRRVLRASKNQGLDLRKAFEVFDKNGDGMISPRELQRAAGMLGVSLSDAETRAMVKFLDKHGNNDGQIEYEELFAFASDARTQMDVKIDDIENKIRDAVHAMAMSDEHSKFSETPRGSRVRESTLDLNKAFAIFDTNGDGKISRKEFRNALKKLGLNKLSPKEFSALCRRYDSSGDGSAAFISYEDFIKRVQYTKADLDTLANKLRSRVLENAKRGISHWETFRKLDTNGDGTVSKKEFRDAMAKIELKMSEGELRALMQRFGQSNGGQIKFEDFCRFLAPRNEDLSYLERRLRQRLREMARIRGGLRSIDLRYPFTDLDVTGTGRLSKRDFETSLGRIGLLVEPDEMNVLFARFDTDGDGMINYEEFAKFIDLDDREMEDLCRRLYDRLIVVGRDSIYAKGVFGVYDRYNETGVVLKVEFRDGCRKLGLPLTVTEQDAIADRFALLGDSRKVNYHDFLQWIASGASNISKRRLDGTFASPTRGAGWHGSGDLSPNRRDVDIFGSVEASDDAVWNSKTVSGWLNRAASPRQRRRFNEVYSSLASYKERNRGQYPRVPEVGGGSLGSSTRLNALHASLPGMRSTQMGDSLMAQTLPGGYGTIDTRMLGGTLNLGRQTLGGTVIGAPGSPLMSRFQLSTVDVEGEVEREFRDNRSFFQRTGKWACPVCFWATNKGFSQVSCFAVILLYFFLVLIFTHEYMTDSKFFFSVASYADAV